MKLRNACMGSKKTDQVVVMLSLIEDTAGACCVPKS